MQRPYVSLQRNGIEIKDVLYVKSHFAKKGSFFLGIKGACWYC